MIGSRLVWKMAWQNMKRHWKQTLLTALAGAIGTMLLSVSFINYESVKESGQRWVDKRFGPVDWELAPLQQKSSAVFTAEEAEKIIAPYAANSDPVRILPIIKGETVAIAQTGDQDERRRQSKSGLLMLGFADSQGANFDAKLQALQLGSLRDDEVIIDDETARTLGLTEGDAIKLTDYAGNPVLFQIRMAATHEQAGLIGFRGANGAASGTVIVSEQAARKLSGLKEGYHTLLAGSTDPSVPVNIFPFFIGGKDASKFDVRMLKSEATSRTKKLNFGLIIAMISSVAVVSSALMVRQVLIMIAESRKNLFGVLRAIGLSQRQVRGIFAAEALLLSLFSATIGTVLGTAGGYGLIKLFYGQYAEQLSQMSGANIPIEPHIALGGFVLLFVSALIYFGLVTLGAVRQAGRVSIVEMLRGAVPARAVRKRKRISLVIWCSLAVVAAHLYTALLTNSVPSGDKIGTILLLWIGGCIGAVILALWLIERCSSWIGNVLKWTGFPLVSVGLAIKYLSVNRGRTVTVALLFAFVMMTLTFTANITAVMLSANDVERNNMTMLGYGGYIIYDHAAQKDAILRLANEDEWITANVSSIAAVEPYMLLTDEGGFSQAFVPVTKELLQGGELRLIERDPQFKSDDEAWAKVMSDPGYIVLPISKRWDQDDNSRAAVRVGDKIVLPVYADKLRATNEQWQPLTERAFTVAGFADSNSAKDENLEVYDATYVHQSVHQDLRPYGFKWPNQHGMGFVLLQFDYRNVEVMQQLKDRLIMNGILTFKAPYAEQLGEQMVNRQLSRGFIGFTALSALIGLFGLAIVQFRAVHERGKAIAMMRCIGLSAKQMSRMFVLEGSMMAIAGLLIGWGIGSSGAAVFFRMAKQSVKPHEQPLSIDYPFELLVPLLIGLVITAVLINIGPARAALRLSPADALRETES
ncbi:ABC transporter permease [Paenibacillus sp. GCM10027626]|uniref:ABC transporter permease n=1 Tax=Paenibacillus sp. GCM10027626 TaxID=3273411 RepID=UPI00362ADC29